MYSNDELFDIRDERGVRTGETMSRGEVHRTGALHGSVHIWVLRGRFHGFEVLVQKRADDKDSFPGCFDAAVTGHIDSGEDPLGAAVREMGEEIGVYAKPASLIPLMRRRVREDNIFHGERFVNNEITWVYIYRGEVADATMKFEREEISELRWVDGKTLIKAVRAGSKDYCIDYEELKEVLLCAKSIARL